LKGNLFEGTSSNNHFLRFETAPTGSRTLQNERKKKGWTRRATRRKKGLERTEIHGGKRFSGEKWTYFKMAKKAQERFNVTWKKERERQ